MSRFGLAEELTELEASLLEDPSPRNVMRVADACRLAGQPERAIALLEVLVAERPAAIAPLVLLAWCQQDFGRAAEADATLQEVRSVDPANPFGAEREGDALPRPGDSHLAAAAAAEQATAAAAADDLEPAGESAFDEVTEAELESFEAEALETLGSETGEDPEDPAEEELDSRSDEEPQPVESAEAESEEPEPEAEAVVAEVERMDAEAEPEAADAVVDPESTEPDQELEPESTEPESEPGPETAEAEIERTERALEALQGAEAPEEPSEAPVAADPEAEAEPERALTREELADVPPSPLYSATLAEIFERQGFDEKAMEIYAEVVRAHPERVDLRERIAELERRLPAEPGR